MTIRELQKKTDIWIKKYGVRYFDELTNLALLMEETGELARIMARKFGDQSFKMNEKDTMLEDELADILFVLVCIANQTGVDLNKAIQKNFKKKTSRDKHRHKANRKLKNSLK